MAVFIQIPAIISIFVLVLAFITVLPTMYSLCYTNSWWTANGTAWQMHPQSQDQTTCKNSIPIIFMAVVGAIGAIIVWAFSKTGQHDVNQG